MAIVEKAVRESEPGPAVPQPDSSAEVFSVDGFGHPIIRRGTKSIEQISAEHRKRFPKPIEGVLAVDIVRADRDSR